MLVTLRDQRLESCVSYSETKTDLVSLSLRKRRIAITGNSLECKYCNFKINSRPCGFFFFKCLEASRITSQT